VLSRSLQKAGERLRLKFRLDDVQSGESLWTDRYDHVLADMFDSPEHSYEDPDADQQLSTVRPQPRILLPVPSGLLRTCGPGERQIHGRPPNGPPLNRE